MLGGNINKFIYPLQASRGYVLTNLFKKNVPKNEPVLGRWKLKYQEQDLEKFYRNIPDPGYYLTPVVKELDVLDVLDKTKQTNYTIQYNHLDKPQK